MITIPLELTFTDEEIDTLIGVEYPGLVRSNNPSEHENKFRLMIFQACVNERLSELLKGQILNDKPYIRNQKIEEILTK